MQAERLLPFGPWLWGCLYAVAAFILLIPVLVLSIGTGITVVAYICCGLYTAAPTATLCINLFCTLLGWFFCCWWGMLLRLVWARFRGEEYQPHRSFLFYGSIIFFPLSSIGVLLASMQN